ncbi:MAG TPA: ABC transporter permease [Chryseosolibacter sp.]|nr:ABC transporter permease [Chryseosolibacter sp.]
MILHYFKIAWRSLLRKKAYSVTTLTGLSLGLASCFLILLFVIDELSYDQYHLHKQRIYRLATAIKGSDFTGVAKVNGPWGPAAKEAIPEIEAMSRFVMTGQLLVENGAKRFYEPNGFYADSSVFHIFTFPLLVGDAASALSGPNHIVVTRSFAKKYFGEAPALGQTLRIDGRTDYTVTGVIENVPPSSHFTFDYLLSIQSLQHPQRDSWVQWNQFYTYLLLRENADPQTVARKIKSVLSKNINRETAENYTPFLQPITKIHLHSRLHREMRPNSDVMYIYIFSSIALLILAISSANFVNMTTAQAIVRGKEIGVRKVNGAIRKQLVIQLMIEVVLICFLSTLAALTLAVAALPALNELTSKNMRPVDMTEPVFVMAVAGVTLLTALLAGTYPAFYQASLKPLQVLKGQLTPARNTGLRKSLVVFQFALSSSLVIAAVVIFQQLLFIQSKPLGFDPQQIITIPIQSNNLRLNCESVKTELLKHPGVIDVSLSGNIPGGSDWGLPTLPEGFTSETTPAIRVMAVDHRFLKTYRIELASGRDFSVDFASDTAAYLINEEAARQLGWSDPLSRTFSIPAAERPQAPVIGVVKDFHFRSIREKIAPLLFFIPPRDWYSLYSIKIDARNAKAALEFIEEQWARFDPEHPFTYTFFDDGYSRLYQQERRLGTIVGYLTAIGIFLACLGLYSLASYTTEQRTKEIGIRKAIGASTRQIIVLLSKQYLILVVVGFGVALPLAWYVVQQWLESFAYHVDFSMLVTTACGAVLMVIAMLTVGYRAMSAARANPIDSLRNE